MSTKAEVIRKYLQDYADKLDKEQRESNDGISVYRTEMLIAFEALNILNDTELYMLQKLLDEHIKQHL